MRPSVTNLFVVLGLAAFWCPGCTAPERPLRLESKLDGQLKGDLNGAQKVEGPITIRMQGLTIPYEGTQISDEFLDRVKPGKPAIVAELFTPNYLNRWRRQGFKRRRT